MSATRAVVQLQEGPNHLDSVTNSRTGLTFLEVAMMVRTLHANNCYWFGKNDQDKYAKAVNRLCAALYRAMTGRFIGNAGNQFRETFQASLNGKQRTFRIDIEVMGRLSP